MHIFSRAASTWQSKNSRVHMVFTPQLFRRGGYNISYSESPQSEGLSVKAISNAG